MLSRELPQSHSDVLTVAFSSIAIFGSVIARHSLKYARIDSWLAPSMSLFTLQQAPSTAKRETPAMLSQHRESVHPNAATLSAEHGLTLLVSLFCPVAQRNESRPVPFVEEHGFLPPGPCALSDGACFNGSAQLYNHT